MKCRLVFILLIFAFAVVAALDEIFLEQPGQQNLSPRNINCNCMGLLTCNCCFGFLGFQYCYNNTWNLRSRTMKFALTRNGTEISEDNAFLQTGTQEYCHDSKIFPQHEICVNMQNQLVDDNTNRVCTTITWMRLNETVNQISLGCFNIAKNIATNVTLGY